MTRLSTAAARVETPPVPLGIPTFGGAQMAPPRPPHPGLIDQYGRTATDLRVSLTDRCNLRCAYCMPADGLQWLPRSDLLNATELARLITLAVRDLGITEVRFTGGEPLLRPELQLIISAATHATPRPRTSLTTNGIGLDNRAAALADAGLDRVNVSLDTLDAARFARLTRRDRHTDVLAGLRAAYRAGLRPLKINAVLMRGVNDDEAVPLLRFCLEHEYRLRFIEQMPLDAQHGWERGSLVTAEEILDQLAAEFTLTPVAERGSAPAELWLVDGGPATVGVIGSVTRPFCAVCDRTRLTADGQLRNCLFARTETDLRTPLRAGATDTDLAELWRDAMWAKAAGHRINETEFAQPARPMSAIGG